MSKVVFIIFLLVNLHGVFTINAQNKGLNDFGISPIDDSTKFANTSTLIWGYLYSNPDSAALLIQQNIVLAQKIKKDNALFLAYVQYSILEQINGNYTLALQYALQSLKVAEHSNNFLLICNAYSGLGDIYREAGDFEQSIYYLRKSQSLLEDNLKPVNEKERNPQTVPTYFYTLTLTTQTFERFNQLDSAMVYANLVKGYLAGTGTWKVSVDSSFISLILSFALGNIFSKSGDYSTALKHYRNGAGMAINSDSKKDLMENYSGMAIAFRKMGLLDSSIYYANKVLELSKVAHFPLGKLEVLALLSEIYKFKHEIDSVAKYLALTIETKDSLFNTKKIMEIQSITFNEELRKQELIDQQRKFQSRLRTYLLSGGLVVVLLLAGILYRNNLQKNKAKLTIEKAYEDLKTTQTQLIHAGKMASLGELTAGIAHEIQNPLNFVNNFSEINKELLEELKNELHEENEKGLLLIKDILQNEEKIIQHGKRADIIVKGMLQHSRSSADKKELTDINALCGDYLRLAYHGVKAKDSNFQANYETHFDPDLPRINVVPQELGRALLNIINNAFQAVNEKARQGVFRNMGTNTPPVLDDYQPTVTLTTLIKKNKVIIKISDNGPGVPEAIKDKIFQPFFTTKSAEQGTGLGLSLAYDIITKGHGGTIIVNSGPPGGSLELKNRVDEEGAEFIISLPVN